MAWTYLAVSEEFLLDSASGCDLSPIVKTTSMRSPYFLAVCLLGNYALHLSGTMLELYRKIICQDEVLISSMEASPARISVLQELERAWQESEAVFSTKLSGLQKKLTRRLCSLKTSQVLELGDFEKSLEHLPIFGMTVDGRVSLPQNLEPRTLEKDGSYLPTITAKDYGTGANGVRKGKQKQIVSLNTMARKNLWPTPVTRNRKSTKAMTPSINNGRRSGGGNSSPPGLEQAVELASGQLPKEMQGLNQEVVKKYQEKWAITQRQTIACGKLSPMWIEWLMGYPFEWTELKPWAMRLFPRKCPKHLKD